MLLLWLPLMALVSVLVPCVVEGNAQAASFSFKGGVLNKILPVSLKLAVLVIILGTHHIPNRGSEVFKPLCH